VLNRTTHVRAALVDLRANLEAKLRAVCAIEACVNALDSGTHPETIEQLTIHLTSLWDLHCVSADLLLTIDGDLTTLTGASTPHSSSRV
jgi:hypothetical protein